jgi:hypothetical protein
VSGPAPATAVIIDGWEGKCRRHDVELHGYPCWGCQEEWARRSPRVRALIARQASGKGAAITPAQITRARKDDEAAIAAYDGPHDTTVERAGAHGPVSRMWNALCTEGCGWSFYWLPSKQAAQDAADEHRAEHS